MISLDQVLLLEEKVENAVRKIEQLNAENAALRRKCAELTNALSAKTEQFSSFQSDQGKIEEGILKALERLNVVENAVHTAATAEKVPAPATHSETSAQQNQPVQPVQNHTQPASPAQTQNQPENPVQNPAQPEVQTQKITDSFDTAAPVKQNIAQQKIQDTIQPAFDIF